MEVRGITEKHWGIENTDARQLHLVNDIYRRYHEIRGYARAICKNRGQPSVSVEKKREKLHQSRCRLNGCGHIATMKPQPKFQVFL